MSTLFTYLIRIADDSLVLGHRLSEWCGHGPVLEEDIAMTNISLDLLGQATSFYKYAAKIEGKDRNEDDLAYMRFERDYKNVLLVEQANGDFGMTMMRQFLFDAYRVPFFEYLTNAKDKKVAAIAEKSLKETKYHLKHSSEWVIRLGDGTKESHERIQYALDTLWRYTSELFYKDEIDEALMNKNVIPGLENIESIWNDTVKEVITEATLKIPENSWTESGGRKGIHSENMGFILADLQYMQRAYPGLSW